LVAWGVCELMHINLPAWVWFAPVIGIVIGTSLGKITTWFVKVL